MGANQRVNESDGNMPTCGHNLSLSPIGKCQPLPVVLKLLAAFSQFARLLHLFVHTHLRRHDQHAVLLLKRLTILAGELLLVGEHLEVSAHQFGTL